MYNDYTIDKSGIYPFKKIAIEADSEIFGTHIESFKIKELDCSATLVNDLLDFTISKIPDMKLKHIELQKFRSKPRIEPELLSILACKATHLEVLKIVSMPNENKDL